MIKKTSLAEYAKIRANGLIAINLIDGDELQWVGLSDGQNDIIVATQKGQAARFRESEVRPLGRGTQGVTAIRLKGDDEVIGMEVVEHLAEQLLVVTEQGFGKRTDVADFPVKHRATGGVIANSLNEDTGDVAAIRLVGREDEELMLITELGTILRTEVGGINRYRRASRGVTVMKPGPTIGSCRSPSSSTTGRRAIRSPKSRRREAARAHAKASRPLESAVPDRPAEIDVYADEFSIYAGNANKPLAERITRYLKARLGEVEVFQFANENIFVRVMENVREQDVFLVQPTCRPVNQSIMELLIMIDAFKRASRRPDHRGHPVLQLRPIRQEGPAAGADHGPPDRRHAHRRRGGSGPDHGPAPGPDPGLLQHPGRRADRRQPASAPTSRPSSSTTSSSSPSSASPRRRATSPSCCPRRWRSSRSAGWATSIAPR